MYHMYHPQIYSSTKTRCFFRLIMWIEPFNMQWHLSSRSACIAGGRGLEEGGTYCWWCLKNLWIKHRKVVWHKTPSWSSGWTIPGSSRYVKTHLPFGMRFNTTKLAWKMHVMIHQNHAGLWMGQSDGQPTSSKWPFDHPNGGHLTPEKVT